MINLTALFSPPHTTMLSRAEQRRRMQVVRDSFKEAEMAIKEMTARRKLFRDHIANSNDEEERKRLLKEYVEAFEVVDHIMAAQPDLLSAVFGE